MNKLVAVFASAFCVVAVVLFVWLRHSVSENTSAVKLRIFELVSVDWLPGVSLDCYADSMSCLREYDELERMINYDLETPVSMHTILSRIQHADWNATRALVASQTLSLRRVNAQMERRFGLAANTTDFTDFFAFLRTHHHLLPPSEVWRGYLLNATAEGKVSALKAAIPRIASARAFEAACQSAEFSRQISVSSRLRSECGGSATRAWVFESLEAIRSHFDHPEIYSRAVQETVSQIPEDFFLSPYSRQDPTLELLQFLTAMRVPTDGDPVQMVQAFQGFSGNLNSTRSRWIWRIASFTLSLTTSADALLTQVKLFPGYSGLIDFWPRYFSAVSPFSVAQAFRDFAGGASSDLAKFLPLHEICQSILRPVSGFRERLSRAGRRMQGILYRESWGDFQRLYGACRLLPEALAQLPGSNRTLTAEIFTRDEWTMLGTASETLAAFNQIFKRGQLSLANETCSICLVDTSDVQTDCGHYFHEACLNQWFQRRISQLRSMDCPNCRQRI